jgi:hypothetical protein
VVVALVAWLCASCGSAAPPHSAPASALDFAVDAPTGGEAYTCFGFDAAPFAESWLHGIAWTPPSPGAVALHHAALYALAEDYPDGPVPCDAMPAASTMHVWAPGAGALILPEGVAIALPAATRRLVVQAHAIRLADGPAAAASVLLDATGAAPVHAAAWLPAFASVPAIPPHAQARSSLACMAAAPMHVVTAWPHMHRIGTSFEGAIVHADGSRTVFVDVAPWDFDRQLTYAVDRDVAQGEGVESDCSWNNASDQYVLPGLATSDEMCGDGLIVWPAQSAAWLGACR